MKRISGYLTILIISILSIFLYMHIKLPYKGSVYFQKNSGLETELIPAQNILILVSRICVRDKGFLTEGSTSGVDAYLVKSDPEGNYRIPEKILWHTCSRVVLIPKAYESDFVSVNGQGIKLYLQEKGTKFGDYLEEKGLSPNVHGYNMLNENDIVLIKRDIRIVELKEYINEFKIGGTKVTDSMRNQAYCAIQENTNYIKNKYKERWNQLVSPYEFICNDDFL